MSIGIWQILIVAVVVILLFGRGRISSMMGDLAGGIKAFKKGMADETEDKVEEKPAPAIDVSARSEEEAEKAGDKPS